jgi:SpoVK/Ycf46/Vps4 family AAA+-type ATPase
VCAAQLLTFTLASHWYGTHYHRLTQQDLEELGARSEGRSGADIHVLVHDAIYQPLRKIQHATHFKQVQIKVVGKTMVTGAEQQAQQDAADKVAWESSSGLAEKISEYEALGREMQALKSSPDGARFYPGIKSCACGEVCRSCKTSKASNKSVGDPGMVQLFSRAGVFDVQWAATADREWNDGVYWTPCSPGDPDAVATNWMKLPPKELLEPLVDREDMEKALHKNKPTVNAEDLEQLTKWTLEFGEEG